ncbi:MAG: ribonuclease P protein component [Deltaproteobacteria bacterium]|nr:ribonuclease P protein component [Deltaproteobacteria bacterium]
MKLSRLRTRSDFLYAKAHGKKLRGRHLMLQVARPASGGSRLGITVSRKVGNAVVRNRVRRRLKEIVRLASEPWLPEWDLVVIAFPEAATTTYRSLREELTCLIQRAHGWACSRASSSS